MPTRNSEEPERFGTNEKKSIYTTTDGGENWSKVNTKWDNNALLYNATFLTEDLGFISVKCNQTSYIYRTDDRGITWKGITLPPEKNKIFAQPEIPFKKDGKLHLLVSQHADYDEETRKLKAEYVSNDNGITFKFNKKINTNELSN